MMQKGVHLGLTKCSVLYKFISFVKFIKC